jgi:hypothetical protein
MVGSVHALTERGSLRLLITVSWLPGPSASGEGVRQLGQPDAARPAGRAAHGASAASRAGGS